MTAGAPAIVFAGDDDDDDDDKKDKKDNHQKKKKKLKLKVKSRLEFGTVASDIAVPGTVIINASTGSKTVTGGAIDFGGHHRRIKLQIKGERYSIVYVTLPSSIRLKQKHGHGTALVDGFTLNQSNPLNLGHDGKETVYVGAIMHLNANQPAAKYRGRVDIEVDYQ